MSIIPGLGELIGNTVGKVVEGGIDILKRYIPDKNLQMQAEMELRQKGMEAEREGRSQEHEEKMAQAEITKIEAGSTDAYVRRARPTVMWICALAMAYNFIGYPMLQWIGAIYYPHIKYPELPNAEYLYVVLMALLGLGGYRTFEKVKGIGL